MSKQTVDEVELVTVKDVAVKLKISPALVRKLIKAGTLETVKLGPRTIRIKVQSLMNVMCPAPK